MKVGRKISSFLLYKLWGWKVEVSLLHVTNAYYAWRHIPVISIFCGSFVLCFVGQEGCFFDEERMVCMAVK